MKLSETLFAPALNMQWQWKGTEFNLLRDGEVIWTSLISWTPSWEYPGANCMAKLLAAYINTPVVDLKEKKVDHISKMWFHEPEMKTNFERLVRFLLAADRRIGKNTLSVWLFVEPDRQVRNIIGRRV